MKESGACEGLTTSADSSVDRPGIRISMLHLPFQTDLEIEYPPATDDRAQHLELTEYRLCTRTR